MENCENHLENYARIHIPQPFPAGNPIGGITFVLRGLTDAEAAEAVMDVKREEGYSLIRAADRKCILYALGIPDRLGEEGWDYKEQPTAELLRRLRPAVIAELSRAVLRLTYPEADELKN